jgi:hypothetical protein
MDWSACFEKNYSNTITDTEYPQTGFSTSNQIENGQFHFLFGSTHSSKGGILVNIPFPSTHLNT